MMLSLKGFPGPQHTQTNERAAALATGEVSPFFFRFVEPHENE